MRHSRSIIGWLGGKAATLAGKGSPVFDDSGLAEYLAAHRYEAANKGSLPIRAEQGHSVPGFWGVNVAFTDFAVYDVPLGYRYLFPVAPVMTTVRFG
jgi:hypothetical protein